MSNQLQQDHHKVNPKETEEEGDNSIYMAGGHSSTTKNRFLKDEKTKEHIEGIDDWEETNVPTQYMEQEVKNYRE